MARLLFAGLFAEGSTDIRFLESIVNRTLVDIAYECKGEIEIELKVISIDKKNLDFRQQVYKHLGQVLKIMALCCYLFILMLIQKTIK